MSGVRNTRGMNRRSFLAIAGLSTLGAAALSACGGTGGSGGETTQAFDQPDGQVPDQYKDRLRVVMWSTYTDHNGEVLAGLAKAFNDSQSDIYVEIQVQGTYDETAQKVAAGLQARQVPDLTVFSEVSWHRFFLNDTLEPLDDYFGDGFEKDVYIDQLRSEGELAGATWWLPFARSTPLFYYNRTLFEQVGLPDRAPKTWSELRSWGPALAGATFNGNAPKLHVYPQIDGDWQFQGVLWNFGGGISNGLDVILDSDESIAAGEFERALVHDDGMAYMTKEISTDFANGLVATVETSTGSLRGILETATFDVGTGFVPKELEPGLTTGGGGLAIMKGAAKERKEAAFEFIKFLAQPENSATWTVETGYMPATKAAVDQPALATLMQENPNFGVAVEQLPTTRVADDVRLFVPNANVQVYEGLQKIWADNQRPEDVFVTVAEELRRATEEVRADYESRMG